MDTVVEQTREKQAHNNHDTCLVDVPENCIFDILVRLPVKTVCSSRLVCKSWFEIINSHDFRNAHLHRSEDTSPGLIFLTRVENYSSPPPKEIFSVESDSMLVDLNSSFHIKFLEIKDGKRKLKEYNTAFEGEIVATCNGLIVLKNKPLTRLIIFNPVTRELEDIPLGTILSSKQDLYGLAFCHVSRRYKLLHLFTKDMIGCEIMDVGSGSWRVVDVPPTVGLFVFHTMIFAMGALHWIQHVDCGLCMGSMTLDDEKFMTMAIPETGAPFYVFYSIFAMGEFLGYAGRLQSSNKIGVWILRGLGGECRWEKQYNIDSVSRVEYKMTTLLCYGGNNGHSFIYKCAGDGCLYAYDHDRHSQHVRKIEDIDIDVAVTPFRRIFTHVNSLVSWRS